MSLHRAKLLLVVCGFTLLLGAPVVAEDCDDAQLFRWYDTSSYTYGGGRRAKNEFFFTYDGLIWTITAPDTAVIGKPGGVRRVYHTASISQPRPDATTSTGFESFKLDFDELLPPALAGDTTRIDPFFEVQENSHDTSCLGSDFVTGNRFEWGYIEEHCGYMVSAFLLNAQTQEFQLTDMDVVFEDSFDNPFGLLSGPFFLEDVVIEAVNDDPLTPDDETSLVEGNLIAFRPLPITFDDVFMRHRTKSWGVEVSTLARSHPTNHGGMWELMVGARYLQFSDRFTIDARNDVFLIDATTRVIEDQVIILPDGTIIITPVEFVTADEDELKPGTLADSLWDTWSENQIVGPQIGVRYFKLFERWTCTAEAKFMAGYNSQVVRQKGTLGTTLDPTVLTFGKPFLMDKSSFKNTWDGQEFSPVVEMRLEAQYQLTSLIALNVGWNAIWVDNIARASNMIEYKVPTMGILADGNNTQDVFMNGLNIGVEVCR